MRRHVQRGGHSRVRAPRGICHVPAGDSRVICRCDQGKHSRSSSRSRLFQHPAQHSARFPHPILMLRLYGCTYFPTGHSLLNGLRNSLRRLSSTPASSQSLISLEFLRGGVGSLEQCISRHHTCVSPLLAASHSERFIWWCVRDDTHFLLTKEVLS
jgi:hypothetical protein